MFKGACKILYVKKFLRNLYINLLEFSNLLYEMGQDFLDSQYKGMERIFDLNRYPAQNLGNLIAKHLRPDILYHARYLFRYPVRVFGHIFGIKADIK